MQEDIQNKVIIYQGNGADTKVRVQLEGDTVWLTQAQIAVLYGKGRSTITEHIQNIFSEGELDLKVACREFRQTKEHGVTPQNITLHLKNIYSKGELGVTSTCKNFLQVQNEGEYKKYQAKTLSSVEKAFLDAIAGLEKTAEVKLKEVKGK